VTRKELAHLIDHTLVRADATQREIIQLCREAVEHGFRGVSVNPAWTSYCAKQVAGSKVRVNPTVGFPLGANTANMKVEEARDAIRNGAGELDVMINIGALKSGFANFVERELAAIIKAAQGVPIKVILETSLLTEEEKVAVCEISKRVGADFVKTSTGFGKAGATVEDVRLMREVVGNTVGVKAAGGIRTLADMQAMLGAGANRIGTSASLDILDALRR
jgi:deoxyribose-phosphate aldolase